MNKKGIQLTPELVVVLILVLIGAIFLFIFVVNVPKSRCDSGLQTCRVTMVASHKASKVGIDFSQKCPQDKRIVFEEESPEEINAVIANALERCVVKFNEGIADLSNAGGKDWESADTVCFICAEYSFKGKAIEEYKKANAQGNNFVEYLRSYNTECTEPKQRYMTYITNINNLTQSMKRYMLISWTKIDEKVEINPEKDYVVIFDVVKEGKVGTLLAWKEEVPSGVKTAGTIVLLAPPLTIITGPIFVWRALLEWAGIDKKPSIQEVMIAPTDTLKVENCEYIYR